MFQANSRSNHISKWCTTGIISKKTFIDRRQASYLSRWLKRMTSILVHPSHYFWNFIWKIQIFLHIYTCKFLPHYLEIKGSHVLNNIQNKAFLQYVCMKVHAHTPTFKWLPLNEQLSPRMEMQGSQNTHTSAESQVNLPAQELSGWKVKLKSWETLSISDFISRQEEVSTLLWH